MLLSLEDVGVGYPNNTLFADVSLTFEPGEWIAIVGPNGRGKSTLLKTLAGTLVPRSGRREARFASCGFVPQRFSPSAASPLTTREFLSLKGSEIEKDTIDRLGLREIIERPLRILSGGQLQRVLIAFACLGQPPILFMDEALEGVDLTVKSKIGDFLQDRRKCNGLCVVEVTHDLAGLTEHAERVIMVDRGVVFDGHPRDESFHDCVHTVYGRRLRLESKKEP